MAKIIFGVNTPSLNTSQVRGGKITAIKMEIARVNNQAQMGLISQTEAQMKIAALESKLSEIEFGPTQEIAPEITPQIAPVEQTLEQSNDFSQEKSPDEGADYAQQQDSFFSQQAAYNRAFHNI